MKEQTFLLSLPWSTLSAENTLGIHLDAEHEKFYLRLKIKMISLTQDGIFSSVASLYGPLAWPRRGRFKERRFYSNYLRREHNWPNHQADRIKVFGLKY